MIKDIAPIPKKTLKQKQWYQNIEFIKLMNIVINNIVYDNLPEGLDSRYIERCLFEAGCCALIKSKDLGFIALPMAPNGKLNVYWEPTQWTVIGCNFSETLNEENSVMIRNNYTVTPEISNVIYYAKIMTDIQSTINTQLALLKMPYLIRTTDKDVLTYKNIIQKKQDDEVAIFVNKQISADDFEVMNTPTQYYIDKLFAYKRDIEQEFLQMYGYTSTPFEKAERLITDEVNSNNEITKDGYIGAMIKMRQEAMDKANEKWGLNIKVRLRRDNSEKEEIMNNTEEGENDGELHNGTE